MKAGSTSMIALTCPGQRKEEVWGKVAAPPYIPHRQEVPTYD
jgi:hypothetical protein